MLGVALPAAAAAVALVAAGPPQGPGPVRVALAGVQGMASVAVDVPAAYHLDATVPGQALGPNLTAVQPTAETDALAGQCGVTPEQTWQLQVGATTVPLFVAAARGFAAQLVLCRPPDLPPFALSILAITQPAAPGSFRWSSLWMRTGLPPLEAQSLVRRPVVATLRLTRQRVSAGASGSFLLARGRAAAVRVTALVDGDSGAVAGLAFHDLGPCTSLLGAQCVGATLGSTVVRARATVRG